MTKNNNVRAQRSSNASFNKHLLALSILSSLGITTAAIANDTVNNACYNCPSLTKISDATLFSDNDYYQQVTIALTDQVSNIQLRDAINTTISANHKKLSYAEVWTALTVTDQDPQNSDNVILIYKGNSIAKHSNGSGPQSTNPDNWNREHVWAKSHGFPSRSAFAYTDIHHLRPSDISVNSARGNLDFDLSDNALTEAPQNRVDSDSFEPNDNVKGDVARMLFYMDVRYNGNDGSTPDLTLVDHTTSVRQAQLGKICTLLAWSNADPVSDFELSRNNAIYEFQGNRNPFIDHPEWIDQVFTNDCSNTGTPTPSPSPTPLPTPEPIPEPTPEPIPAPSPTPAPSPGNGNELFISEYVEGSSFNKALEIYNPTAASIALSDYSVIMYSNGSTSASKISSLSGELAAGEVLVLGHKKFSASDLIDQVASAVNFNGDDYVELVKNDQVIDFIGVFGVKTKWGKDKTYVRKSSVTSGNTDRTADFDVDVQWLTHPKNTFSFLGEHQVDSAPDPSEPTEPTLEIGQCNDPATMIHAIQGIDFTSTMVTQTHIIEGVVSATMPHLSGYFVQEELSDYDDNEASSEAIFVHHSDISIYPTVGHQVRVIGEVKEFYSRTQLTTTTDALDCGDVAAVIATTVSLPLDQANGFEAVEGMLVNFNQPLSVTNTYKLARFGQLTLSSGRLIKPTNIFKAGSAQAIALAAKNSRNKILLDDLNNRQNPEFIPFPAPSLSHHNTLRLGDSVADLVGIIDYSYGEFRILPTLTPMFVTSNPRTQQPELNSGGSLKIASFNVLNYFNGDGAQGGFPTARGADTFEEFNRQSDKIVSAILSINADIVGLMEIENDGYGPDSAIATLVNNLNSQQGSNDYAFVHYNQGALGSDAITVGLIYQPANVSPVGAAVTTTISPFDYGNRQPLVQSFKQLSNDQVLTIAVNHFKSKGGCSRAKGSNQDQHDGQGCWNTLRTQAATTLVSWLATDPTLSNDQDFLIIGDLNAYGKEDPINTITDAGFKNLLTTHLGFSAYSYAFQGEMGYLDHALASPELAVQVVDTTVWHINADEPHVFDYNTERKSAQQLDTFYSNDAYRASDHDPVVIALNLQPATSALLGDLDNDNDVDRDDLRAFMMGLRRGEEFSNDFDFNHDQRINTRDIRAMSKLCTRRRCASH